MNEPIVIEPQREDAARTLMWGIYGLQIAAFFTAMFTGLAAVILAYLKRDDVRDSVLASHYAWAIGTFWVSFWSAVVAALLAITIIGIPAALLVLLVGTVWVLWRILRGFVYLSDGRAIR